MEGKSGASSAVIPAPIAYIKIVGVKKLVVCFLIDYLKVIPEGSLQIGQICLLRTVKKLECSKQFIDWIEKHGIQK